MEPYTEIYRGRKLQTSCAGGFLIYVIKFTYFSPVLGIPIPRNINPSQEEKIYLE